MQGCTPSSHSQQTPHTISTTTIYPVSCSKTLEITWTTMCATHTNFFLSGGCQKHLNRLLHGLKKQTHTALSEHYSTSRISNCICLYIRYSSVLSFHPPQTNTHTHPANDPRALFSTNSVSATTANVGQMSQPAVRASRPPDPTLPISTSLNSWRKMAHNKVMEFDKGQKLPLAAISQNEGDCDLQSA